MVKLPKLVAEILRNCSEFGGYFENFGAVVGDKEFILYYDDSMDVYLCHISEFEQDGVLIKLKEM